MRHWKAGLAAAAAAQFLCVAGWQACPPFFPYYVRELGVVAADEVRMWSGLLISADAASMALTSPFWGALADRYGAKAMAQRAALGGCLFLALQALVNSTPQLLLLRLLLGAATATIPAYITLVASIVPPGQVGFALGAVQVAVYAGLSLGPLAGGVIADHLGYRSMFLASGAVYLLAFLLTTVAVRKPSAAPAGRPSAGLRTSLRTMLLSAQVRGAVLVLVCVYMGNASYRPLLPLLVEAFQPSRVVLNTTTGLAFSAAAAASAMSAALSGRLSDRVGHRRVLITCGLGAALAYVGHALAPSLASLAVVAFTAGFFTGGLTPAANAALARVAPATQRGAIYGLSNSVNSVAKAIGPLVGSSAATLWGLRPGFLAPAALFALIACWGAMLQAPAPQGEGANGEPRCP